MKYNRLIKQMFKNLARELGFTTRVGFEQKPHGFFGSTSSQVKILNDYFQLRIPRDLKTFFDEYVDEHKPLGMTNGNELMRHALISEANELRKKMDDSPRSKPRAPN